jgi:beta-mannanase
MKRLYPGDRYVDWTCLDGYNWGDETSHGGRWRSFRQIFRPSYLALRRLAPRKPILIGETASTERGGSKAAWIRGMFAEVSRMPQVRAVIWFDKSWDGMDWPLTSSPSAQAAFAAGSGHGVSRAGRARR